MKVFYLFVHPFLHHFFIIFLEPYLERLWGDLFEIFGAPWRPKWLPKSEVFIFATDVACPTRARPHKGHEKLSGIGHLRGSGVRVKPPPWRLVWRFGRFGGCGEWLGASTCLEARGLGGFGVARKPEPIWAFGSVWACLHINTRGTSSAANFS